jgi:hypothetical protein
LETSFISNLLNLTFV